MISIYKHMGGKLGEVQHIEDDCWVNVVNPGEAEIKSLIELTGVPHDFLTDALDVDERARIETDEGWVLVVVHTPMRAEDEDDDIPFRTIPLGIIKKDRLIITVCRQENEVIQQFLDGRVKNFLVSDRARFIIQVFLNTAITFLRHLKEINKKSNMLEDNLHKSMQNEALIKLVNIEKSLVYFMTSVKANELIMSRMTRADVIRLDELDKDLLEDAITENLQAIHMTKIYSNILSGLMDAFASIISNNLNVVMKVLTSVTIILMIPNLIASIYGMNVELPFQHSMNAFLIVVVTGLFLSIIGVLVFVKKKWL